MNQFSVMKKSSSNYDSKIHEGFLFKKYQLKLNKQLYKLFVLFTAIIFYTLM